MNNTEIPNIISKLDKLLVNLPPEYIDVLAPSISTQLVTRLGRDMLYDNIDGILALDGISDNLRRLLMDL